MKIVKPDSMALIQRVLPTPIGARLCVGLIVAFRFEQPGLEHLLDEQTLWGRVPTWPGAPAVLDEGYAKPCAEFMTYGDACAPGGRAVDLLTVSVRVGETARSLRVSGDRRWNALGLPTAAQPFVRMPLGLERAYGGPGDAANPRGRGFAPATDAQGQPVHALPNLEDPAQAVAFPSDRPAPAWFGGQDSGSPARLGALGTLDETWLREGWPAVPAGTGEAFYQCASPAQWLRQGLRGDESLEFVNLHPSKPVLQARLPGLRARCGVWRGAPQRPGSLPAPDAVFEEMDMRPETLWLLPNEGYGVLLYRGTMAVRHPMAHDALALIADWERLQDAPLPTEAYAQRHDPRPAAPVATAVTAPASTPASAPTGAAEVEAAAPQAAVPAAGATAVQAKQAVEQRVAQMHQDPDFQAVQAMTADMEARQQALLRAHGLSQAEVDAFTAPAGVPDVTLDDVHALTEEMKARAQSVMAAHGLTQAEVDAFIAAHQGPGPALDADMQTVVCWGREMEQRKTEVLRNAGLSDVQAAEFLRERGAAEAAQGVSAPAVEWDRLLRDLQEVEAATPPTASALPAGAPAAALPAPQSVPLAAPEAEAWTRERVAAHHAQGGSLAKQDLRGLDLSGLDLRGADLREADLAQAQLKDALMQGCRLDGAMLTAASLEGADLQGASLQGVHADRVRMSRAQLDQAVMGGADLSQADLAGASLRGARCARASFEGARMSALRAVMLEAPGADFSRAVLDGADFTQAQLGQARFNDAELGDARFTQAQAAASEWYGARAARTDWQGADLRGARGGAGEAAHSRFDEANFEGACLDDASWEGVSLRGARLRQASLQRADFSLAQAAGADLVGVRAQQSRWDDALLNGALASHANFMGASLRRADLGDASLVDSNLHAADLEGAAAGRAQLAGALLTRTLLDIPGRPEIRKEQL